MKKSLSLCLALLLMASIPAAAADVFPYETSGWAREEVAKAVELGIVYDPAGSFWVTSDPITRGAFAQNAASLVAREFGSHLDSYLLILRYRGQAEDPTYSLSALDVSKSLGILRGRGDGDDDAYTNITRQEAAVMLARTYRAYQDTLPTELEPLDHTDQADIADWAVDDVRLMNHLGVMTGVGDGRFDPLGSYTVEQCLVSLVRLYEKAPGGGRQDSPFLIPDRVGFRNTWEDSELAFAVETEDYYICAMMRPSAAPGLGSLYYDINIINRQDLALRSYPTPILEQSNSFRGVTHARPKTPSISGDGTKLYYTVTLEEDAYHIEGLDEPAQKTLLFQKGVYTVTVDLATGGQTWTRADLA